MIETLQVKGNLSTRIRQRVLEWALLHQDELMEACNRRGRGEHPGRIPPLE